jgi:Cellulose binding domain
MKLSPRRLSMAATFAACALLLTVAVMSSTPARAAVLFSDDFEQPTHNVWLTGSGGSWSVATEDGSNVWKQSSTTLTPTAWAGSGSGPGTVVTARVKPTSPLSGSSMVSVAGKVANPNNLYYAGLRGTTLEIGFQAGSNVVLASTPFNASIGAWYTLSLSFPTAGRITGSVTGPGGASATVSAADPGGPQSGDKVGFYMRTASASLDDIRLTNTQPPTPPPAGACPATITIKVNTNFGTGFLASVSFTNISPAPIAPPWTITWRFNQGQYIQNVFNASFYQVGPTVSLTSAAWFPTVAPGATSSGSVGFIATTPAQAPTNATFNGISCPLTFS